jgi:L-fuconolactonase
MDRRDFLTSTGTYLLVAGSASGATSEIVDTHIHLYDPTRPQGVPWPAKADALLYKPTLPRSYGAIVRPLGVTRAIVVEASPWIDDNQWVLELAKANPIIAGLVGHLDPAGEGFRDNLARFSRNPLFRGIRLNGGAISNGVTRTAFLEDLKRLADADLMLDAIGNASMISGLITLTDKIPKLRIVIDHMPGEPPGWQSIESSRASLRELAQRPQVYSKVSGVLKQVDGKVPQEMSFYQISLDEVWNAFGTDRVIYGSNWPVSDRLAPYSVVLEVIKQYVSGKGPVAADKFFRTNSKSCYKWIERG